MAEPRQDLERMLAHARELLAAVVGDERATALCARWVEDAGGRPLDLDKMTAIARAMQNGSGYSRTVGRALEQAVLRRGGS